jgi:hypothetical protein
MDGNLKDNTELRKQFAAALRTIPDGPISSHDNPGLSLHSLADAIEGGTALGQKYCDLLERAVATLSEMNGNKLSAEDVVKKMFGATHSELKVTTAPEIGDEMADGTIYAGISPDTNKPMYATPMDAGLTFTFNQAQEVASMVHANGHNDWCVPSKGELNVLWENRNKGKLAGTFDVTGSYPAGWYWSSSPNYDDSAWAQRFSDGHQGDFGRVYASSLRCVR